MHLQLVSHGCETVQQHTKSSAAIGPQPKNKSEMFGAGPQPCFKILVVNFYGGKIFVFIICLKQI